MASREGKIFLKQKREGDGEEDCEGGEKKEEKNEKKQGKRSCSCAFTTKIKSK
jgi:hypothetical protein